MSERTESNLETFVCVNVALFDDVRRHLDNIIQRVFIPRTGLLLQRKGSKGILLPPEWLLQQGGFLER